MTWLLVANAYALGWLASWLVLLRNFARSSSAETRTQDARNAVLLATVWPAVWPTVALVVAGRRLMAWLRPSAGPGAVADDDAERGDEGSAGQ